MFENFKKYCKENSIGFFLPISFVLAIVPIIVRAKNVNIDSVTSALVGGDSKFDLFSQNKSILLMFFSIILLIFMIVYHKKIFEKKDKIINIVMALSIIFIILSLISSICSPYKSIAFWGVYNRAEGFVTILCYFTLFIYSLYTFKKTGDYHCLLKAILVVVFVNAFLGIFQFSGNDLLKTSLGKAIAVPSKYGNGDISLLYEKGNIYGTLFHYNYVGSFAAIVTPILFCAMIIEFDIMFKLILGMGFLSSIWLLFGSTSRAGIIGICSGVLVALIVLGRVIFKNKKRVIISLICAVSVILGINFMSNGTVFRRIPSLAKDIFSVFSNTKTDYKDLVTIRDIKHNNDGSVSLMLQKETLNITFKNNKYFFTDSSGNELSFKSNNNIYTFDSAAFKDVTFSLFKTSEAAQHIDIVKIIFNNDTKNQFAMFKLKPDNTLHMVNPSTLDDLTIKEAPSFGFKGKEKLGSSRGYIWSRSIPLLKDNILIGKGPDTFMYIFPNDDFIAKYYSYGNTTTFVDKPHDLYLQIALNNGVIALIVFLLIMLIYIIDSFKLYGFKKEYEEEQFIGISLFIAIISYLAAGVFNDSIIGVAPIFWIVLGVGFAVNYKNKQSIK